MLTLKKQNKPNLAGTSTKRAQEEQQNMDDLMGMGMDYISENMWRLWYSILRTSGDDSTLENSDSLHPIKTISYSKNSLTPTEKLRKSVRKIKMLISVCISIRSYATEHAKDIPNLSSLASDPSYAKKALRRKLNSPLFSGAEFDPGHFKADLECKWPKHVRKIMRTRERTQDDIAVIRQHMRALHSFRPYTREMQDLLCTVVRYERCKWLAFTSF